MELVILSVGWQRLDEQIVGLQSRTEEQREIDTGNSLLFEPPPLSPQNLTYSLLYTKSDILRWDWLILLYYNMFQNATPSPCAIQPQTVNSPPPAVLKQTIPKIGPIRKALHNPDKMLFRTLTKLVKLCLSEGLPVECSRGGEGTR